MRAHDSIAVFTGGACVGRAVLRDGGKTTSLVLRQAHETPAQRRRPGTTHRTVSTNRLVIKLTFVIGKEKTWTFIQNQYLMNKRKGH